MENVKLEVNAIHLATVVTHSVAYIKHYFSITELGMYYQIW